MCCWGILRKLYYEIVPFLLHLIVTDDPKSIEDFPFEYVIDAFVVAEFESLLAETELIEYFFEYAFAAGAQVIHLEIEPL